MQRHAFFYDNLNAPFQEVVHDNPHITADEIGSIHME